MLSLVGLTDQTGNRRFAMSNNSDSEEQKTSAASLPENNREANPSRASDAAAKQTQSGDGERAERAPRPRNMKKRVKKFLLKLVCGSTRAQQLPETIDIEEKRRPVTAEQIKEYIDSGRYHEASRGLIVLEHEAYGSTSNKNEEELTKEKENLTSLFNYLGMKVSDRISTSIEEMSRQHENEPSRISGITEAVRALAEQVAADLSETRLESRPKSWKRKWEKVVKQSVYSRMNGIPEITSDQNSSSFSSQLEHMGKTMKSDLTIVVNILKTIYPEDFDVCNVYARHYHEYFSSQLYMITDFELEEKDTWPLLVWVHHTYPKEIMCHPDLVNNVTWDNLGCLLPAERISNLERQHISYTEALVEGWMNKSLDMEVECWANEKQPAILNSFFHSELHIDIIQGINVQIEGAGKVSPELGNQLLPSLVERLADFLRSYKRKFEEFIDGSKNHKHFEAVVIASINSCDGYRKYIQSLESHHLANELKMNVCTILSELENTGSDTLLQGLVLGVQPHFKKLSQKNGLCSHGTMVDIIKISRSHISKFSNLKPCYYQEIMEKIHLYLVKEYITRLMKRKVSQKNPDQQEIIANQISENGSLIRDCCIAHGSQAQWLNDAIPKLAEIIRLQDIDAIKLIVASLACEYPDISKPQVAAILYIKGNLRSSEVKSIQSILDIREKLEADSPKLFSHILAP